MDKQSFLLTKPDKFKDVDKWDNGKNVLFITGLSGSGKTTLAEKIEKDKSAILLELDGFEHGYDSSEEHQIIQEYLKSNDKINKDNYYKEMPKVLSYIKDIANDNPGKSYIVEGIQLLDFQDDIKDDPTLIKNTGMIKSSVRASKRNGMPLIDTFKLNRNLNQKVNKMNKLSSSEIGGIEVGYKEQIYKQAKAKSKFKKLEDNKVDLTPEERKECLDRKAVWHFSPKNTATPAVWKSQDKDGKVTYVTNTHRAYNTAPTLKGAIGRFHSFIKSTASEETEMMEKEAASFDARRKKQYWQMLKKMYGNTDEAISAIKRTGDAGIYHGTRLKNISNILDEGLIAGNVRDEGVQAFGKGIYFGDIKKAQEYKNYYPDGGIIRLKKPSEFNFKDDTLYPKATKVFDLDPSAANDARFGDMKNVVNPRYLNKDNVFKEKYSKNYDSIHHKPGQYEMHIKTPVVDKKLLINNDSVINNQDALINTTDNIDNIVSIDAIKKNKIPKYILPTVGVGAGTGAGIFAYKKYQESKAASEESEEMEKQALLGVPGAITGMILGGAAGAKTGNVLAGLKYKPTHSQQKLLAERELSQENFIKARDDYNAKKDSLLIDWDTYDDLVNEVNSPDFDDLTVSEVEDYAKNKYFSLNKSASLKSNLIEFGREEGKRFLTGAGLGSALMGSALGSSTYRERKKELTNPSYVKNLINQDRDAVINYTNKLKSLNPNSNDAYYSAIGDFDHNSVYSPSLLAKDKFDVACEGSAYYGEALNDKLKEEGVDYKTLPWKQYKNLLALNADSIGEDDGTHSWELKTASIDTYKDQIYKTAKEAVLESRTYTVLGKDYQLNKLEEAFKLMQYLGSVGASRNVRVMIDGDGSAQFKFKDLESSKEEKDKFHEFTNTGKPDFDVSIE